MIYRLLIKVYHVKILCGEINHKSLNLCGNDVKLKKIRKDDHMTSSKKLGKKLGLTIVTLGLTCLLEGALSQVHADTYYGNGVYCNSKHCYVDWGEAVGSIANNLVDHIGEGMRDFSE